MTLDSTGAVVGEQRYLPYGGTRVSTGTWPTDRLYTGQRAVAELGIYHFNARFYSGTLGRFLSADTLVPEPGDPQALNRYAYVYNQPLRFTDPSGHCAYGDADCLEASQQLYGLYGGITDTRLVWALEQVNVLLAAAGDIAAWFERNGGNGIARMRGVLGPIGFTGPNLVSLGIEKVNRAKTHHVEGSTVYLYGAFDKELVIHEVGHVLDNRAGGMVNSILGWLSGPSMPMSRDLGWKGSCPMAFTCDGYGTKEEKLGPNEYGRRGPSEDFAEAFRRSVVLDSTYPLRDQWMAVFASLLVEQRPEFSGQLYPFTRYLPAPGPAYAPTR